MKKLLVLLTATLSMMAVTSCDKNEQDEPVQVNAANLKGTWEGGVERDSAQGYPQKWRIQFDGEDYTTWHTYRTLGSEDDEVQGLKTVGNKEEGTWAYSGGALVLTPSKQYASYYETLVDSHYKGVYRDYNTETMESSDWYVVSEALIQSGVERDLQEGTDWYISKWKGVKLTKTALTITINRDKFVLVKK